MWNRAVDRSRTKGFEINIDRNYLVDLFIKQNGRCSLSGLELKIAKTSKDIKMYQATTSLDRIDSNKGYICGNLWIVHKDANFIKHQLSLNELYEMCHMIHEHSKCKLELATTPNPSEELCHQNLPLQHSLYSNPAADTLCSQR